MVFSNNFKENCNYWLDLGVCMIGEFSFYDKKETIFDHLLI